MAVEGHSEYGAVQEALRIYDIQECIIEALRDATGSRDARAYRKTLLSLAVLIRDFRDIATSAIWCTLPNLHPILNIMPSFQVEVCARSSAATVRLLIHKSGSITGSLAC